MSISVIITTFKRPALLPRALRSVLGQRLENCPVEVIVSDDDPAGSGMGALAGVSLEPFPDRTVKYVKRASGRGGVAASRNRALSQAVGEWVLFLDDDDLLTEGALQRLLDAALAAGADFCAGNSLLVHEDAQGEKHSESVVKPNWTGYDQLLIGNVFPIGSFLMRKSAIHIDFNTNLKTHEDWLFLLDNLASARVAVIDMPVLEVRQSSDASRPHRNTSGGYRQMAADYIRIYSLHPAGHLAATRAAILAKLPAVDVDELIGGGGAANAPQLRMTQHGRFIICNQEERDQGALVRDGAFEVLPSRIAIAMLGIRPGLVVDVGAGIGVFSVSVTSARPGTRLLCVESRPAVFMHLCANLLVNGLQDSRALNVDLESGRAGLSGAGVTESSTGKFGQAPRCALDEMVGDEPLALIRLGMDAAVLPVLEGGGAALRRWKPALLFKIAPVEQYPAKVQALLQFLQGLGYAVVQIGEDCFAYNPETFPQASVVAALASIGLHLHS